MSYHIISSIHFKVKNTLLSSGSCYNVLVLWGTTTTMSSREHSREKHIFRVSVIAFDTHNCDIYAETNSPGNIVFYPDGQIKWRYVQRLDA